MNLAGIIGSVPKGYMAAQDEDARLALQKQQYDTNARRAPLEDALTKAQIAHLARNPEGARLAFEKSKYADEVGGGSTLMDAILNSGDTTAMPKPPGGAAPPGAGAPPVGGGPSFPTGGASPAPPQQFPYGATSHAPGPAAPPAEPSPYDVAPAPSMQPGGGASPTPQPGQPQPPQAGPLGGAGPMPGQGPSPQQQQLRQIIQHIQSDPKASAGAKVGAFVMYQSMQKQASDLERRENELRVREDHYRAIEDLRREKTAADIDRYDKDRGARKDIADNKNETALDRAQMGIAGRADLHAQDDEGRDKRLDKTLGTRKDIATQTNDTRKDIAAQTNATRSDIATQTNDTRKGIAAQTNDTRKSEGAANRDTRKSEGAANREYHHNEGEAARAQKAVRDREMLKQRQSEQADRQKAETHREDNDQAKLGMQERGQNLRTETGMLDTPEQRQANIKREDNKAALQKMKLSDHDKAVLNDTVSDPKNKGKVVKLPNGKKIRVDGGRLFTVLE